MTASDVFDVRRKLGFVIIYLFIFLLEVPQAVRATEGHQPVYLQCGIFKRNQVAVQKSRFQSLACLNPVVLPTSCLHTSVCSDTRVPRYSSVSDDQMGFQVQRAQLDTFAVAMMNDLCYCEILSFSAI